MPHVVQFNAPRDVALVEHPSESLTFGHVRVATWYSGISAGAELTAYRGSNSSLTGTWDPQARLFREGTPSFGYPVAGWGYSEMGAGVRREGCGGRPASRDRRDPETLQVVLRFEAAPPR